VKLWSHGGGLCQNPVTKWSGELTALLGHDCAQVVSALEKSLGIAVFVCLMAAGLWFIIGQRGPSKLPDFDSAEFVSIRPGAPLTVKWKGDKASAVGLLFEGVNRDLRPSKWTSEGELTFFHAGKAVAGIQIFSNSQGAGRFKIGDNYYLGYDQSAFQKALLP